MSSSEQTEASRNRAPLLRLRAAIALPLLLGAAALAYWLLVDGVVRDLLLEQNVSYAGKGGNSEVGNVSFSIFGPKLRIEKLETWQDLEDGGKHKVLFVKEAVFDVEFWPLLERRLVVNQLTASEVRWKEPIRDKPEPELQKAPDDTCNPTLNEYLARANEIAQSEELQLALDWIETLRKYTEGEPSEAKSGEQLEAAEEVKLGPPRRAHFVAAALSNEGAKPAFVMKRAGVDQLDIAWGSKRKKYFARKVSDLLVTAEEVSSDPVLYGRPMRFRAEGNLDGDAGRRAALGLLIRFDADELVKVEQVEGLAGLKSISLNGLADTSLFGETLTDASITLTHFAGAHADCPRRTRLMLSGAIQPPGSGSPSKAGFSLWFGGFEGESWTGLLPSGIGVHVEEFPVQSLMKLAGGSPLPLQERPATVSFGTCDEQGNFGTPDAALTWHSGLKVRIRLDMNGVRLRETQEALGGMPGALFARGLNRVIEGLEGGDGLRVIVGFEGSKERVKLDLLRPGLRAFVDAVVNALEVSVADLKSVVELPFGVDEDARIKLRSVNADGSVRDVAPRIDEPPRHDLKDLRVSLNLAGVNLSPLLGQATILGLPAQDFCRAFNALAARDGGLALRARVFDGHGVFSPALESPGLRGLVDAMASTLKYTGAQANQSLDLPLLLVETATVDCRSVDAQGATRGLQSPGAESNELRDLRLGIVLRNGYASKKKGHDTLQGVPADYFTFAWNKLQDANKDNGLTLTIRLFDDKGAYAPALLKPNEKDLLKMLGDAVGVDDFAKNFGQIAKKYGVDFADFQKRGADAAKDIASGKVKLPEIPKEFPKEPPKELPKLPDVPKPKLPWEK